MSRGSSGMKLGVVVKVAALALLASAGRVEAQRIVNPGISTKAGPNEGKRPVGWMVRSEGTPRGAGDTVRLEHRGQGYYLTSGPPSIVWNPKNKAQGNFVMATTLFSGRMVVPDGFGVFLGGRNMDTPNAEYTEFLVRNSGHYTVIQHVGARTVTLRPWTEIAGISQHNGDPSRSVRNQFRVIVDDKTVSLVVNRNLVTSFVRAEFKPDGEYGMRIGTRQFIQIEQMGLEKPAK